MKKYFMTLCALLPAVSLFAARPDTLRILAIGNSFSEDAVEQNLADLARADGNCAIIGNLYIAGCPLSRHLENVRENKPAYRYRFIDENGVMTTCLDHRLSEALKSQKWDVVTLQQSSPKSGKCESYEPYLGEMVKYLRGELGDGVRLMFQQTWAYSSYATHPNFPVYECNSQLMYDSVMVASRKACERYALEVIPSGTAIQNARGTRLRDNLYRDGYHLSHACGRYTCACTWYEAIFRRPVSGLLYRPGHVSAEQALICQLAAAHAVANPYSVTEFGFGKPKGNYDEARVPDYVLPDALCCEDGSRVKTQRQWERKRRPEILRSFTDEVYGRMPEGPYYERFELLEVKEDALGGLATRKRVRIYLDPKDKVIIDMLVYTPKNAEASPLFLGMNFFGNSTISHEEDIHEADAKDLKRYGDYRKLPRGACAGRWPLEKILSAGYGVATYYCGDVDPDYDDSFTKGAQSIYPNNLGKVIGPDQWGTLACWAWGLSRAMDYLCTDSDVDASRVALVGHSRLAKAALWAAATDRRFAMVAANESGCGGAALSRRAFGETVGIINRSFPHWFCDNFKKYSENEQALPVDQHELLALIAPRPLCVGSAADDLWSDPKGERLSLEAAVPVYELYGKGCSERLGYHIREGRHEIKPEDWDQYLRHADKWLK